FIIVVNLFTSICVFVTAIALYYFTRQESYLYTPFSGFHGVLSGFLVGIKQILPDQELSLFVFISILCGIGTNSTTIFCYRERGARALEQRLAAEKLSAMGKVEGTSHQSAAENV
ncbi:hypothetical protein B296_00026084, partial [Ensete ventricosum]